MSMCYFIEYAGPQKRNDLTEKNDKNDDHIQVFIMLLFFLFPALLFNYAYICTSFSRWHFSLPSANLSDPCARELRQCFFSQFDC